MKKIVLIFSILICLSACSRSTVLISKTAGAERVIPTEKQPMDAETLAEETAGADEKAEETTAAGG